jgi:hypothetical protein
MTRGLRTTDGRVFSDYAGATSLLGQMLPAQNEN